MLSSRKKTVLVASDRKDVNPPHIQQRGRNATQAILRASLELAESSGLDSLTVEGIADHCGIAKTTIYRRWPNVSAILMDAVLSQVTAAAPLKEQSTVRQTFAVSMKLLIKLYTSPDGDILRTLIGRAQVDDSLRITIETNWVEPRRKLAREVLRRGIQRGEIRPDLDTDIVLDLIYGAIYHRLLVPYKMAKLNERFADDILDTVFRGVDAHLSSRKAIASASSTPA